MAIYVKDSNGELKEPTPVANWGGGSELVYPSSAWTRVGDQKYQVWPELPSSQYEGYFNIYDEATLIEFRDRVNAGETSLNALVTADFTIESLWGTPIVEYLGIFEGGGHTISGLEIETGTSTIGGLFSRIRSGSIISNLTITSPLMTFSASGVTYGAIAGISSGGTITNCNVTYLSGRISAGSGNFGGIVGATSDGSVISNCSTTGLIQPVGSPSVVVGGIAGYVENTLIENCENEAIVQGRLYRTGGICGFSSASEVRNCINNGAIVATGSASTVIYAAGIVATAETTTFTDCTNNGSIMAVTSSSGGIDFGGGIVAQYDADCTFTNCVNNGSISASTIIEV